MILYIFVPSCYVWKNILISTLLPSPAVLCVTAYLHDGDFMGLIFFFFEGISLRYGFRRGCRHFVFVSVIMEDAGGTCL